MLESVFEQESREPEIETDYPELWPRRKKIMIIDDDLDFRLAVSEILVEHGFEVMTAKDGESGLNHLIHSRERPDLILVDLMMPNKTGMEFRREQLKLDEINEIPVVFVTGHGIVEGELCIQKPLESREFIDQLKRYL